MQPPAPKAPAPPPSAVPGARQARQQPKRDAILEAARRVFTRKGIREARMEEIAAEAGLSVGGLYWYYDGKNALLTELLTQVYDADLPDVEAIAGELLPARERLLRLATLMEGKHLSTRDVLRVALEYCQTALTEDQAIAGWQAYAGVYRSVLARVVQDGIDKGEFLAVDAPALADALWALYDGLNVLWLMHGESMDLTRSFRSGVDAILRGIEARG